jgi:hypothetical protein
VDSRFFEVLAQNLDATFTETGTERIRRRRASDEQNLLAILQAVFANLAFAVVAGPSPRVAVPLAKPKEKLSRYERRGFRLLPRVLVYLDSIGTIILTKSRERGWASTIEPSAGLLETIRSLRKLSMASFGRADGEETIILSRSETNYATGVRTTDWEDYPDTDATIRYRAEMARINSFLADASITFRGARGPSSAANKKKLRRVFNKPKWSKAKGARFDLGGRLYGGWWQNVERGQRKNIRIEKEPIADLDFQSMFVRLAYLHAGVNPPDGDLYAGIRGFEDSRYRDGIKKVLNSLLFAKGRLKRLPRGSKEQLPPGTTLASIRAAILAKHPALKPIVETGVGFKLMFMESEILVSVLLKLGERKIVALPMHDGIMVAQSDAPAAIRAMRDISQKFTGHRLPVARK